MKKKKLNLRIGKVEKDKSMNPDFEQNHYSRTAKGTYRIGHDSLRLVKWLAFLIILLKL